MSLVSISVWVVGGVGGESGLNCCVGDGRSKR